MRAHPWVTTVSQVLVVGAAVLGVAGCGHKPRPVAVATPPSLGRSPDSSPPELSNQVSSEPATATGPAAASSADAQFVSSHPALSSEEGVASWYGPPYNKRRGANGQIFDQDALTAAHRTLPLNSLIRVTNLATGQAVVVRVTDRGPFVPGRLLDLSLASAKAIGVWRPGTARVRVEVFATPSPLDQGGRWCVQIGAFNKEKEALKLRDQLTRKYRTANVIEFTGPTGHWVRIRPLADDRGRAVEISHDLEPTEGAAYLVRLD